MAGQMVLDIWGRYDTACFHLIFLRKLKCGDLNEPFGASPTFILLLPVAYFSRLGLAISLDKEF